MWPRIFASLIFAVSLLVFPADLNAQKKYYVPCYDVHWGPVQLHTEIKNTGWVTLYFPAPQTLMAYNPPTFLKYNAKYQAKGNPDIQIHFSSSETWRAIGTFYNAECYRTSPNGPIAWLDAYQYLGSFRSEPEQGDCDTRFIDEGTDPECSGSGGSSAEAAGAECETQFICVDVWNAETDTWETYWCGRARTCS